MLRAAVLLFPLLFTSSTAWAQSTRAPRRHVPPTVLAEVAQLQNRFDLALAIDCDAERCFSKGCTYVDHAIADRGRAASLPGLGDGPGPGSVEPQAFLTKASCGFAVEDSVESEDVQVLVRRLQAKMSSGWTVVTVQQHSLEPLPTYVQQTPLPDEEAEAEPSAGVDDTGPEVLTMTAAGQDLWRTLLPHAWWMVAMFLATMLGTTLLWAYRRVGRQSLEERMLIAELERGETGIERGETAAPEGDDDEAFVREQEAAWTARLAGVDPDRPNPELQALIGELLRSDDMPLLAKAVLRFPDQFPTAFPTGGGLAAAKLELATYLKTVDVDALPDDADFFRALNRHALSATLAAQSDTHLLRTLRDDFGTAGLAALLGQLAPLASARLFALAPADEQHELVRLLPEGQLRAMAGQLLQSNRMAEPDTAYLSQVLEAARNETELPEPPPTAQAADHGASFDAAGALSVILGAVGDADRAVLFERALKPFQGSAPSWYRGIFLADMLFEIPVESRADVMLDIDVDTLSAWMSLLDAHTAERLLDGLPESLRRSIGATGVGASRARQLALAERGRRDLARSFHRQLARLNMAFERVIRPSLPVGGV